ncbi:hypothetical protein [Thermodesulforhabdus norvegica]|uniref:DUF3108 domain-containing protein n=1 Tax=Thermodesulforhabdus norvegica TaxID=39841 RepID=A0A1I4VQ51_9BACT|nr:hypothetical protein [Thermodesulforhabdus norvegica]SFN03451.1 hypothetical protein SAMN05660836_02399 [Thermodesulforhabdus norvegica]
MIRLIISLVLVFTISQELSASAGQLLLTTNTGKRLTLDYCWADENQVRFEIGGGTATLSRDLVRALEEVIDRKEIVREALEKTAITTDSFDPEKALKDIATRFYGISISFTSRPPDHRASSPEEKSNLYGAITRVVPELSVYQLVHTPPKRSFLFATTFFNTRVPITLNRIYLELLDMDGNVVDRIPVKISLLDVPKKERLQKKIAPLFYVAYAFIPMDKEFMTYQFVLERMIWDESGNNQSAARSGDTFKIVRF